MRLLRRSLLRDVRGRKAQFGAVAITILLGVALFGASFDAFLNLTASYQHLYDDTAFADLTAVGGPVDKVAAAGAREAGVAATATRSVADVPLRVVGDHVLQGRMVGMAANGDPAVNGVLVLRGTTLDPARPDGVLAEQHVADHFGLQPGSHVAVLGTGGWRDLVVLGVVASPEYLWPAPSRQQLFATPDDFGVFFAPPGVLASLPPQARHDEALFRFTADAPGDTAERVRAAALGAGAADTFTQAEQPSNAALNEDVAGFAELSIAFPALFLAAAAFAVFVLLGRLVASQQAVIGTLRASGFPRGAIRRHYLELGLVVGLLGAIPGAIVGGLLADVVTRLYTSTIGVPSSVIDVRPTTVAIGLLVGVVATVLAAFVPARHAASISPAAAMVGPTPTGRGGRSVAERIVPALGRAPVRWRSVLRSIGRSRRRSLSTIGGVVLALTLIVVSWGMIDTVVVILDRQFNVVQRQDAQVWFDAPRSATSIAGLADVAGVAAAEPTTEVDATIVGPDGRYTTTLVGLGPGTSLHGFRAPDGTMLALPESGLLLGNALRARLGVQVGDQVTLDTGSGGQATATVAGFVEEPLGTFAYASLAQATSLAGGDPASPVAGSALLRFDQGADREAVRSALLAQPGVVAYADARAIYDIAQQYMGLFYAFIGVMLVLGGVMALAIIYTTMSANVAERTGEIAAMRTLGMQRGTVARLVTGENLLLIAIGIVPGLVVGVLVAAEFMASFTSDLFSFNLEIQPSTLILSALAVVVVGLLSQWPALRAVRSIDLGKVVRERSF